MLHELVCSCEGARSSASPLAAEHQCADPCCQSTAAATAHMLWNSAGEVDQCMHTADVLVPASQDSNPILSATG